MSDAELDDVRRLVARAKGSINKENSRPAHRRDAVRDLSEALRILNGILDDDSTNKENVND